MTKIAAIITAGGKSERFGSNKLLEKIDGDFLICKTIEKFVGLVDMIVVPCDFCIENVVSQRFPEVIFAKNGACRQLSVLNALKAIDYADFVLIHDGARPYTSRKLIEHTIEEVKIKKAVVAGVKAIDTIKICNEKSEILSTPKRSTLYYAQTPQAFEFKTILDAHILLENRLSEFSDDASLLETLGQRVYMVEGDYKNKKITTREDLNLN